jgi:hypothetical protein
MPDDLAVQDSNDGQRRNHVLVGSQVIHQPSLDHVGTAAESGTVNRTHSRLIRRKLSTQEHKRILSRDRTAVAVSRRRYVMKIATCWMALLPYPQRFQFGVSG